MLMLFAPAKAQVFGHNSMLASGNWVKIGITKSGVYEISYDQLKEMGFADPSKVAVYGQGGRQSSIDFVTKKKEDVYMDDLCQTHIYRGDGKIYFYGVGVENYQYTPGANVSLFENRGLNIYSRQGYYFLTDSHAAKEMATPSVSQDQLANGMELREGVWHTGHEVDLKQGIEDNGQLFWGEDFSASGVGRLEWDVTLYDVIPNSEGYIATDFYKHKDDEIILQYGLLNSPGGFDRRATTTTLSYYTPVSPDYGVVFPKGETDRVYVAIDGNRPNKFARLDHWTVTYRKTIPTLQTETQGCILFPSVSKGANHNVSVPGNDNIRVLQITDPYRPQLLAVTPFGPEGRANFTAKKDNPTLLYFDTSRPQLQIGNYEPVANQNIHNLVVEANPEMAIICTPEFYNDALKLAELHRTALGQRVIVATNRQLYNEFSSGRPDPMAYRGFLKMMRMETKNPVKNILLYGPFSSDLRTSDEVGEPDARLIAMQNRAEKIPYDTGIGAPAFDFYGIAAATIDTQYFENCNVNAGVGVLSVQNHTEAETIYNKIKNYIEDDTFAYRLNKMISSGCDGDNNMHVDQAVNLTKMINGYQFDGGLPSLVMLDQTEGIEGRERLYSLLNSGMMFWNYFGHSSQTRLGTTQEFFTSGNTNELRNKYLPMVCLGGCDLTLADRNVHGVGEHIVLDTPYGGIASIISTRQAWAAPNETMLRAFYRCWMHEPQTYNSDGTPLPLERLESPLTLGEVYAHMKNEISLSNELVYFLAGDPGITLPSVLRGVEASVATGGKQLLSAGHQAVVSGTITKNGVHDSNFNGEVVVRLMEPEIRVPKKAGAPNETSDNCVGFADFQTSMASGSVQNGKFTVKINVPEYATRFNGQELRLVCSAYEHSTRIGGAGEVRSVMTADAEAGLPSISPDTEAPRIVDFRYDAELNQIVATAEDNSGIAMSSSPYNFNRNTFILDGKTVGNTSSAFLKPTDDGKGLYMEFPMQPLQMGEHTAVLEVMDNAGNTTRGELKFTVSPQWARLGLSTNEVAADGSITFIVEGAVDDQLTLFILDNEGNEIYSRTGGVDELSWNCKNSSYEAVAPGLYKAFVKESGKAGHRAHSATIQVAVI